MSFIVKQLEKKLGVDLNGDGVIGSGYGGGMVNKLERATHIDLNGDGVIGGGYPYPPNYHHNTGPPHRPGPGNLLNELERTTRMDLDGDGRIGGQPPYRPNFQPPRGGTLADELERATGVDLNGDGRIGGQSAYPPNNQQYNSYGNPPYNPNYPPPGPGNLLNVLEKTTRMDLNGDGRIGAQPPQPPPNFYPPRGGTLADELERATGVDLNGDGRIGGQSSYPPNNQQYNSYGNPPYNSNYPPPGPGNLLNELERTTRMDLNGDGRIGGQPPHPPPNFYPTRGGTLADELERATGVDLNGDGRIGGQSAYPPNNQQYNSYGNPPYNPNYPPPGPGNLLNELERTTRMDLNGDGRIGAQSGYAPNYNRHGYGY